MLVMQVATEEVSALTTEDVQATDHEVDVTTTERIMLDHTIKLSDAESSLFYPVELVINENGMFS